jgi:sialate O-acetylesterase
MGEAATGVPNTALAVITDVGEEEDVHPQRKAPVGARLALTARALAYGERIESSGPVFTRMDVARGPLRPGITVYSRRITGDRL